ncbi:MAG: SpoIIE family protein phosphatase [Planctomycetes bacterium]|nr:SpoIIE family protein phosphatase [Planctomycetota bacterium]
MAAEHKVLSAGAEKAWEAATASDRAVCARQDASAEEVAAKPSTTEALQGTIRNLQSELAEARELARQANRTLEEMDGQIHLAGKLQQEFLPTRMPEVGPIRFGALFRPVSWVSGDLYDVIRLDETHVGFHVTDVVGHGMPAALMTMFVKKALQTKRIMGNSYQIVPPHVAMGELNADICDQDLASCQFCTSLYCVIDTRTLEMTYCRAGHPEGILFLNDGQVEYLSGEGNLLGVFPDSTFDSKHRQLHGGDRVVLFTDGAEDALCGVGAANRGRLADFIAPWRELPREELLLRLAAAIDELSQSHMPEDDITIVVMDVEKHTL